MLKTRKLISLLLVVAMMLSVFSVAIVSTSAADAVESATIIYDGQTANVHVGDTIRYKAYMDVTPISTAPDGLVHVVTAATNYTQDNLTLVGKPVLDVFNDPNWSNDEYGVINYNDQSLNRGFKFDADSAPMIDVTFTVTKGGESTIENKIRTLTRAENNALKYFYIQEFEKLTEEQPTYRSTLEVTCPHTIEPTVAPTEPTPTEPAPTTAGDKAIVTLRGLDGKSETKEFNVGDTFTVYTTLNASAYNNGGIGNVDGAQLYTNSVLELVDEYDPDEGDILDPEEMFPITKDKTTGNGKITNLENEDPYYDATRGAIFFIATIPSIKRPFVFDDNNDLLIKSNYTVKAGGVAEITMDMVSLGVADNALTKIIYQHEIQEGMGDFRLHSSFTWPEQEETEPAPTEPAPTEPAPTEAAPTEPAPTEPAPTEPAPTEPAPTEPAPADTYIVAGNATNIFGTSWNGNDANNTMTFANDVWSKEYTVSAAMKDVQLKAVKNGTTWIGDETGNNVTFNLSGPGTFTVYCDGTKTWVEGDIVSYDQGLEVNSITAVGNGTSDGDGWLNNITWDPAAEANHMTKVADGIYEAEYTLGEFDPSDVEFKFAVNDAWTHNFGLGDNGVIANGVETDAIYNGSQNLKITGLAAGTTIKMQLDLTGFDYDSKTGAKMTVTWTAPVVPTEPAPTEPAPTEPAPTEPAPTQPAPTTAGDKAIVTVRGLDGQSETKEFNVGDTFTVYTTLNTSAYNNGSIGPIDGAQLYTNAVLELADEYDPDEGDILDLEAMFPITKNNTTGNGKITNLENEDPYYDATRGAIFFNASKPSIKNPFVFDDNNDLLIKSNYTVKAGGEAEITIDMVSLGVADDDLTKIIYQHEIQEGMGNFRLHSSFTWPEEVVPTEPAPTEPAPTEPAPTEPAPTEPAPTEPAPTEPAPTEPAPTEPAPADTYIVAGNATNIFGTSWNGNDTNNTMTFANDVWSKEYTVSAAMKDVQLKAVKNGTTWIGDETGNNVTFNLSGPGTFTVYCDGTKTWVEGDIVSYDQGLEVNSVTAVGNGTSDGDGWLNNITWDPAAEANHMIKVADGIYEAEYTLGEFDPSDVEFKFAINDAWTHNFGLGDNGVIANGVETDAIYNGSQNLKITGLAAGTTIKMQLDLTGFDYDSKTGAKMTVTWTAPVVPTEPAPTEPAPTEPAPTEPAPTEPAPTEPAPTEPAPTEPAPTTAGDKAIVNIYDIYGALNETKEFNVNDTFTVYTVLNAKDINDGKIAAFSGSQTYTDSVVALTDAVDGEGVITDLTKVFPITGEQSFANASESGVIYFNASTPSITDPFVFDSNDDVVIATTYIVTAPGTADIKTAFKTLGSADEDLTKIIFENEVIDNNFTEFMTFATEPAPTEPAPTEPAPTEPAPTEPAPTEPAPTEPAPTEPAPQKAIVNIYDIFGNLNETKEFDVNDTFTVYTVLNAKDINDGKIAAFSGSQTYTDSVVALSDAVDGEGVITDLTKVFPITGEQSFANASESGVIYFNASTPSITDPFVFDSNDDVIIATTYTVSAPGTADIKTTLKVLASADEDLSKIIFNGEVIDDQIKKGDEFMTFNEPVPAPTEPAPTEPAPTEPTPTEPAPTEPAPTEPAPTEPAPTEPAPTEPAPTEPAPTEPAPTEPAPQTATITIYGFNGQSETKTFNVGESFDVYTYLNASNLADGGKIGSLNASQTYTDSIVTLNSATYPVLGDAVVENKDEAGKILYLAATPDIEKAFVFDSDDDVMIKTTYTVSAPGEGEIRNAIKTLGAADEDLTPIIKEGTPIDPDKQIPVEASFTERIAPTDVPTEPAPTEPAPTEPAPTEPAPTEPAPTEPAPTEPAPTEPAPTEPAPTEPAPTEPAPTEPAPTEPAPTEPAPTEPAPTEPAPTEPAPTEPAPTEPTPSVDKIYINADGNLYEVEAGSDHTYTFFLKDAGMIYGLDAATTWDAPQITMVGDPSFPLFGDKLGDMEDLDSAGNVVYQYYNDTDGNINEIKFNWTQADGVDATGKADVITFTIHVDEATEPGIYYINTKIKTLEGADEDKQIYEDTDVKQPPVERDGELDGTPGEKQTDNYTVDGKQTYVKDSLEPKTFTISAEKDPKKALDKFRSLWIDKGDGTYTLVSYNDYTKTASESGALQITLTPDYLQTLTAGDYKFKFVFSDGETTGDLSVTEPEAPTAPDESKSSENPTDKDKETAPAATTKGSTSTTDTASSTNGAAVQTGSPEAAIVFVVLLVMAAGIIIFNKKRRKDN